MKVCLPEEVIFLVADGKRGGGICIPENVNINYRLPIKVYYRICTVRHIRIEIIHGSQNVF
jgi:hypothetical protein